MDVLLSLSDANLEDEGDIWVVDTSSRDVRGEHDHLGGVHKGLGVASSIFLGLFGVHLNDW